MNWNNVKAISPRPRKVLVVTTFPVGGIRTYMRYVYSRINPDKYSFSVLTYDSTEGDALEKDAKEFQVDKVMFAQSFRGHRLLFWSVLAALRKERYDLIHSHGIFAAFNVGLVSWIYGVPHIFTVHGILEESDLRGSRVIKSLRLALLSFVLRSANVMHHVGRDMVSEYRRLLPSLENSRCKTVMIPNGVNVESYAQTRRIPSGNIRRGLGIGDGVFLIGYLGRFMDRKGFPVLVEAMQIIESEGLIKGEYVVVAVGSGDHQRRYMREINARGLSGRIKFVPFQRDVAPVIAEMDLVVMPSLWEACPLLPMEVLCTGIPLIASDCLGLQEVVNGTPTISVPPKDPHALAKAITKAVNSPPKQEFENFRQEACKRFDVQLSAARLEQVYDTL